MKKKKVRLETSHGEFVVDISMPTFKDPPDVVAWGTRTFLLWEWSELMDIYRECASYTVPVLA